MEVEEAIRSRHSCRRFLDKEVGRGELEEICALAAKAPSAINLQPWLMTVVMGEELARLGQKLEKAFRERGLSCAAEAAGPLAEQYLRRQKELNRTMGPAIKETESPWEDFVNQGSLNFYGAPAAIILSGEAGLAHQARFDLGLVTGWLLLACQSRGLATCPIGLVARYTDLIQEALNLPEERPVILALAVGYADETAPVNRVRTGRAGPDEVVRFYF